MEVNETADSLSAGDTCLLLKGDCREVLGRLADNSVDTVITDPPYEIGFMSKSWDQRGVSFDPKTWAAILRITKPGGFLLCFGGTRTYHRIACAIEDAGWEIRDCLMWLYGQGFPKSFSISKQLDKTEHKRRLGFIKVIDKIDQCAILAAWKDYSSTVKSAGLLFQRSQTTVGLAMPQGGSALTNVLLRINLKSDDADVIAAELNSSGAPPTCVESTPSAPKSADMSTSQLLSSVVSVEKRLSSPEAESLASTIAQCAVKDWRNESIGVKPTAVAALRIWLGKKKSSSTAGIGALCVALTNDLKRTILNRSRTFRNSGIDQQMAYVSATTVTIMESIAASLISFMVAMLKADAVSKQSVPARKKKRIPWTKGGNALQRHGGDNDRPWMREADEKGYVELDGDEPVTDEAKLWNGWGTGLKPSWEPVLVAMAPLDGTYVENALKHGVAGLAIDRGRIGYGADDRLLKGGTYGGNRKSGAGSSMFGTGEKSVEYGPLPPKGRWPANLLLTHSPECVQVGYADDQGYVINRFKDGAKPFGNAAGCEYETEEIPGGLREVWACLPSCPIRMMDDQTGKLTSGKTPKGGFVRHSDKTRNTYQKNWKGTEDGRQLIGDSGGASRFFYTSKVSRKEREAGLLGRIPCLVCGKLDTTEHTVEKKGKQVEEKCRRNNHPTMKPIKLMEYLARLTSTPTGGVVLDPFMGTGSTALGCFLAGRTFIGVDDDAQEGTFDVAKARCKWFLEDPERAVKEMGLRKKAK